MKTIVISSLISTVFVSCMLIVSCSKSDDGTNNPPPNPAACNGTPGPLFIAVKTLMQANCQSCHNSSNLNGGKDWTVDCNIVTSKDRIKARAVDNNPSPMPPTGALPQSEKDKITAWINAGGRITD